MLTHYHLRVEHTKLNSTLILTNLDQFELHDASLDIPTYSLNRIKDKIYPCKSSQ